MKVLISGASGLLGGALISHANARGHTCVSLNRSLVPFSLDVSASHELDTQFEGIDHFVHAAANTNVEQCEAEPSICHRDNALLTELLAVAAKRCGVAMTYISSTGVYGVHKNIPWAEYDKANPVTQHHRSKLLGEQSVLRSNRSNLVVRTGWLFGGDVHAVKNFVAKRIREAKKSKEGFIFSNSQQRGCPTNVDDLATRILDLIALRATGVFNSVNTGSASRFEYVAEIVRLAGINVGVRPVGAGDFDRVAPVSDNEMAINWRADFLGLPPMRSWQAALADYLDTIDVNGLR